jgi:acetyl-CoA acetyltransferase family protein
MTRRAALVSACRTPIGKAGRAYADVHATDLLGVALAGALDAAGVDDPARVDQVIVGCTQQAGDQAVNVGRNGWLAAGLPLSVPATTIDAQCGSAQQSVNYAAALVMAGQADLVVAGGVESLTRVPMGCAYAAASGVPYSEAQLARFAMPTQGIAGEAMARAYGITREESDAYGVRSHLRADAGWRSGAFADETVLVKRGGVALLDRDEGIRPDSSVEALARLRPSYVDDGIINAGSASQLSDGSSAVVVASEDMVERLGLSPLAWVRRTVFVGTDPDLMLEGPIAATTKLLEVEGLKLDDIDLFEVHEAYATVVCAWLRQHPADLDRVNVDGGAIALGHPFGASGGRQIAHLAHTMRRSGARLGLQVMCCGGGLGTGTLLELAA